MLKLWLVNWQLVEDVDDQVILDMVALVLEIDCTTLKLFTFSDLSFSLYLAFV